MVQSSVRLEYALVSVLHIVLIRRFIMEKFYTALFCCVLFTTTFADRLDQDPDSFYSDIARKVGVPQVAHNAVEKKFGWKQNDKRFFYATMIKGGGASPDWGVMVTRIPVALQKARSVEERKSFLQLMEMKFVVISYHGDISFPEFGKAGRKKTKPIHPNL